MYLFQLSLVVPILGGAVFTFHYVSISTVYGIGVSSLLAVFTFHYVSISTFAPLNRDFNLNVIYIPLCIYFNMRPANQHRPVLQFTFHYVSISTKVSALLSVIHAYLHSTMYLFQPFTHRYSSKRKPIYIPLCIYFNKCNRCNPHTPLVIYIPLCIYFNRCSTLADLFARYTFTFHYVSISTPPTCRETSALVSFTFHYVSISTSVDSKG